MPPSPRQINRPPFEPSSRHGIVPGRPAGRPLVVPRETEATSSFAFDIRSPLHSHENQFPTLYDLCKIDLPNGRTDASSLVTLAKGERDLWPSLIFELETSRVPDAIHRSRIENELLLFLQNEEILSLSLSLSLD